MNLQGDRHKQTRGRERKAQGNRKTYPKRDITAMPTKTTPAMIIPIIAPDVTLTPESTKGSGCASTANGCDKDKREQKEMKDHALWMNQKNIPAATLLRMRDRREEMKTVTPTGI